MEVENTPPRVETRAEGVVVVKKRPISHFDAREGLGRSKTSPSRRNASRRGGGVEETPRLAFRRERGSGKVENIALASKREPKGRWC